MLKEWGRKEKRRRKEKEREKKKGEGREHQLDKTMAFIAWFQGELIIDSSVLCGSRSLIVVPWGNKENVKSLGFLSGAVRQPVKGMHSLFSGSGDWTQALEHAWQVLPHWATPLVPPSCSYHNLPLFSLSELQLSGYMSSLLCLLPWGSKFTVFSWWPSLDALLWPCSTVDLLILLFRFCMWCFDLKASLVHLEFLFLHVISGWFMRQEAGGRN